MSNPITNEERVKLPKDAVFQQLQERENPFTFTVAAAETDADCLTYHIPDLFQEQLNDLRQIINQYRQGRPQTKVYPILGDSGAGKTHMLSLLRAELEREASEGRPNVLVLAGYFTIEQDVCDYLLWQIVNHLRASKGAGSQLLATVSARLTGALLAEAIRRMTPAQQADLLPSTGILSLVGKLVGGNKQLEQKREALDKLLGVCESSSLTAEGIRQECQAIGLPAERAMQVVEDHLKSSESHDADGWVRTELYGALVSLALTGSRERFDTFHDGGYQQSPAYANNAGNLTKRLLVAWLDLFDRNLIPVILVFDQLEDFLRNPNPVVEEEKRRLFTQSIVTLMNTVADVCILLFAEEGLWNNVLGSVDRFTTGRFTEGFSLPGKPTRTAIPMTFRYDATIIQKMIRTRLQHTVPHLDLTDLPPNFPFSDGSLASLENVTTPRDCLRKLKEWYNEIIFVDMELIKRRFRQQLLDMWKQEVERSRSARGELNFNAAMIPELQAAFHQWLLALHTHQVTGSGPWAGVELHTEPKLSTRGIWNIIREQDVSAPGIGIAAWLAGGPHRPRYLEAAFSLFEHNPPPIHTLVLFDKPEAESQMHKQSHEILEKARAEGRAYHIERLTQNYAHAAYAFKEWYQVAWPNVEEANFDAQSLFQDVLTEISRDLLGMVDRWRVIPLEATA